MGEGVSFMVRCFAIEQLFGDTFAEQICFPHFNKISLWSSMRGGGACTLALSCCDGDGMSARGIVSIDVFVLLPCEWQVHLVQMQQPC